MPVLDPRAGDALVETVAAEAGRVAALLAGDLPHTLVEHAEEAGVELLPYGSELGSTCTCEAWTDPCPHALAVMYQLAWLVEADPFVLLHLRGLARDDLLARLHDRAESPPGGGGPSDSDGRARRRHRGRRGAAQPTCLLAELGRLAITHSEHASLMTPTQALISSRSCGRGGR